MSRHREPVELFTTTRITGAAGTTTELFRRNPDGMYVLIGELFTPAVGFAPPPGAVAVGPDGQYLTGSVEMPDLPGNPGYAGSLDDWVREHGGMTAGDVRADTLRPFTLPAPDEK